MASIEADHEARKKLTEADGQARTANAIKWPHEQCKRRIKTRKVLPFAEAPAMFCWSRTASGMRKVNRWQTLNEDSGHVLVGLAP